MRNFTLLRRAAIGILVLAVLACGPIARLQVTPTPTKTPKFVQRVAELVTAIPTPTVVIVRQPTATETPTPAPPTPTSAPEEFLPPTEPPTPEPSPLPTNTPAPPPPAPPTNTPAPPPPAEPPTPAPPPPTSPPPAPASSGPTVIIDLPDGDTYGVGDTVKLNITVTDPNGVSDFEWGIFTENKTAVLGGDKGCGNAVECKISEEFEAELPGAFQIGVEAKNAQGQKTTHVTQLYVG